MSRTIEAIMRHMAPLSSRVTDQSNGVEKLEKEITVKKRHYIWSESRFVRTMLPFHSNIRVGYNGTEVDGKSVLDLMTLAPQEGTKVGDPYRRTRCGRRNACCRSICAIAP
jgi:PTS HPr component phosphorylation site